MPATIDILADRPKRILMLASNPATSPVTSWPIGFWWAELTHPYWAFVEHGYAVDIASLDGGALAADSWSDPRDDSGYSAADLLSLGFLSSPAHAALIERSARLADVDLGAYDACFLVGGQGPMVTFRGNDDVAGLLRTFIESGRIAAVVCHATCALLEARGSDGRLLVDGRTWTGFANSEEKAAEEFVGGPIQPFRIEDEARAIDGTNFIVQGAFRAHAVRDGNLVTGQQQHSGAAAAALVIQALGV